MQAARLEKKQIVIVDDDQILKTVLKKWFSEKNTTLAFTSGEEALAALDTIRNADVFILDYILPGINGTELFLRLKPQCPKAKFVAITGTLNKQAILSHQDAGWDVLVLKPFDPVILEEHIRAILS